MSSKKKDESYHSAMDNLSTCVTLFVQFHTLFTCFFSCSSDFVSTSLYIVLALESMYVRMYLLIGLHVQVMC